MGGKGSFSGAGGGAVFRSGTHTTKLFFSQGFPSGACPSLRRGAQAPAPAAGGGLAAVTASPCQPLCRTWPGPPFARALSRGSAQPPRETPAPHLAWGLHAGAAGGTLGALKRVAWGDARSCLHLPACYLDVLLMSALACYLGKESRGAQGKTHFKESKGTSLQPPTIEALFGASRLHQSWEGLWEVRVYGGSPAAGTARGLPKREETFALLSHLCGTGKSLCFLQSGAGA